MTEKAKALIRQDLNEETRELIAKIALTGNLAGLTTAQQWDYYGAYCAYLGLDPITRPFDLLTTTERDGSKKTTLYANASCATQIADSRGVTYDKPTLEFNEALGVIIVHVCATLPSGRSRYGEGVADIRSASGRNLENAIKKASTQAHRRATLALCGVAMPDESEVADIEGAQSSPLALVAPESIGPDAEFREKSAYGERLAERVEAYEREKAAKAEKAEPVPVAPTATGLRADVIDLVGGIKKKHKISHAGAIKQISTHLGRTVERAADIHDNELQGVYEMLEQWDADLLSIAQEKL